MYCVNLNQTDWPYHLSRIRRNINAAVNRSTGRTPYEMLYGYQPQFVDQDLLPLSTNIDHTEPQIVFAKTPPEAVGTATKL